MSLPLKNRSKGFNWFFSFLVWFKKIQEDKSSNYILLLDEPGLNLHASAQADLLKFIEDLSKDYQIIYTTHSPFMISSEKLHRTRTVLEKNESSIISRFPLQAALGYDIAQNLFISKKNLLVEGPSDYIILRHFSGILKSNNRIGLKEGITIVPTGGLAKVATFISLFRGSQLDVVCLVDTHNDQQSKAKMNTLFNRKIIEKSKVKFYHEFLDNQQEADIEDLFEKEDYLKLFNASFDDKKDIQKDELNSKKKKIVSQINELIPEKRFSHYEPARKILELDKNGAFFDKQTLDNFEKVFEKINSLFS